MNNRSVCAHDDTLKLYLNDIGRFPLLTADEEVLLAKTITEGRAAAAELERGGDLTVRRQRELRRAVHAGEQARERFVLSNLRLVVSIARKYQATGVPLLDIIQEGTFGLMRAVDKFDWRKGFKFSTYATWWIRQAIGRGVLGREGVIVIPGHAVEEQVRLRKAREVCEERLGRTPTVAELAEFTGLDESQVTEVLSWQSSLVSLNTKIGSDDETELGDVVADRGVSPESEVLNRPEFSEAFSMICEAFETPGVNQLSSTEATVLVLRFGLDRDFPRPLAEVGAHFGRTAQWAGQVEFRALNKLRGAVRAGKVTAAVA